MARGLPWQCRDISSQDHGNGVACDVIAMSCHGNAMVTDGDTMPPRGNVIATPCVRDGSTMVALGIP